MKNKLQYILLTFLLLITGVGESIAQTPDSRLNDYQYYTIVSDELVPSMEEGKWYCIRGNQTANNTSKMYLQGGETNLTTTPGTNGQAVNVRERLFTLEKNSSGNLVLKCGNGYYLKLSDATSSYNSYNVTLTWVTDANAATSMSYVNSILYRTATSRVYDKTVYSYLYADGGKLGAEGSTTNPTSNKDPSNKYRFDIIPVTLVTKYTVTYNFTYSSSSATVNKSTSELVEAGNTPSYQNEDQLNSLLEESFYYLYTQYQVDADNIPTTELKTAPTSNTTITIPLIVRVTKIDQTLLFEDVKLFVGQTKDLTDYIKKKETDANITYEVESGSSYISLDPTNTALITGDAAGNAEVTATSKITTEGTHYNDKSVVISVKVVDYSAAQKAFIQAYDELAAYKDKIGIHLGEYTYNKNNKEGEDDNAEFTEMLFEYLAERNDVGSYADRELAAATTSINALKADMAGKLTLNLPTPGTLLRMKKNGETTYIAPLSGGKNIDGNTNILYYYKGTGATNGCLVAYDNGYHVVDMSVGSGINTGTDYSFTAMNSDATDGLYKANSLTDAYILEDVDSLPVRIYRYTGAENECATLYVPAPLEIPNTLKAFVATSVSGGNITLTRITGVVPTGTCLVLKGPAGNGTIGSSYATYNFAVHRFDKVDDVPTQVLQGSYPVIENPNSGSCYALLPYNSTANATTYTTEGFYPYTGNISHFKCYYVPSSGGAKFYTVTYSEDGIDSIEQIPAPVFGDQWKNSTIYDLQGRRISTPSNALPHGIYIIGGRKVVIK